MKLSSPAKINLFLQVLKKRKDGYHEIRTLFERIDLCDEIILKLLPSEIRLKANNASVPGDSGNLAWRAAELLKNRFKVKKGVAITLSKKIPVSAGLGGGSSNAATVLLGLNRLWKLGLSRQNLMKLGGALGSDVPFFVMETPLALGRGRGEILQKIPFHGPKLRHVLVKPPFGISTKQAYEGLNLPRLTGQKPNVRMLIHSIEKGATKGLSKFLTNSLELSINKRVTTILKIKKSLLKCGADAALLSGSGSTVFGVFSSRRNAVNAAKILGKNRTWKVFVTSTY